MSLIIYRVLCFGSNLGKCVAVFLAQLKNCLGLLRPSLRSQQTPDKIQNISSKKQTKTAVTALLTLEI